MRFTRSRRFLATGLIVGMSWAVSAPAVTASEAARLSGRVVGDDGSSPRAGVVVALVDPDSGRRVAAGPTDRRGAFHFDDAEPGTYRLVAEGPEGAFAAPGPVRLEPGDNPPLALALLAPAQQTDDEGGAPEEGDGEGEDEGEDEDDDPVVLPPSGEEQGLSTLAKWLIAGGVGVVAVLAISEVTDTEDQASPF